MITYVVGDVLQSPARVLVNAVNTVGVMGKGIAYDFKLCYPAMYEQYRQHCQRGTLGVGQLMLYKTPHKWVLNFPTKRHWRASSRLDDLETGLQNFVATYAERGITSASFPRLGTGSGGLDWAREVRPLMEHYLAPLPIPVFIHHFDENDPYVQTRNIRAIRAWLEGTPNHVSVSKLTRDLNRMLNKERRFKTLDGATTFTVGRDPKRKGNNLIMLMAGEPQPVFVSESLLGELWAYVRSAGYALPMNFPGGLDVHARMLTAFLTQLDYVRPVNLYDDGGRLHTGLHYVPPIERQPAQLAEQVALSQEG
ncbi:MAG: macro domain-containing protein [bacterium]|nr:macro domain-containing protein [bacterium]